MSLFRRISNLFSRSIVEQEIDRELKSHIAMRTEDNIAAGMSPEAARRDALVKFGNPAVTKEHVTAEDASLVLDSIGSDIRYALRQLRKSPGFAVTAILTLVLGIGATTAIFTLVHAVLLKSLPVSNPSELYRIGDNEQCCQNDGLEQDWSLFSYGQYKTFQANIHEFSGLAAFQAGRNMISARRSVTPELASAHNSEFVSGNAFQTLGVAAYAGRMLTPADDRKGAAPVAVMSYRLWQEKYGRDPSVIGASFVLNGQPFTIVGIAPPGFFGETLQSAPPDFWMPLSAESLIDAPTPILDLARIHWLNLIGRIAPGASPQVAQNRMQLELQQWLLSPAALLDSLERAHVQKQTLHLAYGGGGVQNMQQGYKDGLHLLFWASGFVLLIACANLANLMLVRATARKQQTRVRTALGASRFRLVRQALTESVVLSVLGGIAGIAVAYAGASLIVHLAFHRQYVPIHATPSWPVLGFALLLSLLTGILFGVAPAWITAHVDPIEALRGASRSFAGDSSLAQKSLVVVQAASSFVLLCLAGLLIQSLRYIQHQNLGFQMAGRYVVTINPQMAGYKPEQLNTLYQSIQDAFQQIPGVVRVSYALNTPMGKNTWSNMVFIEGEPALGTPAEQIAGANRVGPGYFETIGTRVLQGRPITENDTASSRHVAVVNQSFAARFFKNQIAIGKHFGRMEPKYAGNYEIVGVVEDAPYLSPAEPVQPMFFLPEAQATQYTENKDETYSIRQHFLPFIVLQTASSVSSLEAQVRQALAQINPNLPVIAFTGLSEQVAESLEQQSMIVQLTSLFGILALVLAAIGLYGVTAYSVERRTGEIGIRMALGSDRAGILRVVLRGAFLQVLLGLILGIPVTILGGRLIASQLFGVHPDDPAILIATICLLGFAALIAVVIPARRAASVDPMRALRAE